MSVATLVKSRTSDKINTEKVTIIPKIKKTTNRVHFISLKKKDGDKPSKVEMHTTDMIKNIDLYARVIMNVQLLNYNLIDELFDLSEDIVSVFCEGNDIEDIFPPVRVLETTKKDFSGKKAKNIKVVTWMTVDIPYIDGKLEELNVIINIINGKYKDACKECGVSGNESYIVAKLMAEIKSVAVENQYSMYIAANFQKPTKNVCNITARLNHPSWTDPISWPTDNTHYNPGYDIQFQEFGDPEEHTYDRVIFDDRVRLLELTVNRYILKAEKTYLPYLSSRTIFIDKKEVNKPLISKDNDGNIILREIKISMKENPSTIDSIESTVYNFVSSNSRLSRDKIIKFSNLVGITASKPVMDRWIKDVLEING